MEDIPSPYSIDVTVPEDFMAMYQPTQTKGVSLLQMLRQLTQSVPVAPPSWGPAARLQAQADSTCRAAKLLAGGQPQQQPMPVLVAAGSFS